MCVCEREREREILTNSSTFKVRIMAPAASSANATAKTSDWKNSYKYKQSLVKDFNYTVIYIKLKIISKKMRHEG